MRGEPQVEVPRRPSLQPNREALAAAEFEPLRAVGRSRGSDGDSAGPRGEFCIGLGRSVARNTGSGAAAGEAEPAATAYLLQEKRRPSRELHTRPRVPGLGAFFLGEQTSCRHGATGWAPDEDSEISPTAKGCPTPGEHDSGSRASFSTGELDMLPGIGLSSRQSEIKHVPRAFCAGWLPRRSCQAHELRAKN